MDIFCPQVNIRKGLIEHPSSTGKHRQPTNYATLTITNMVQDQSSGFIHVENGVVELSQKLLPWEEPEVLYNASHLLELKDALQKFFYAEIQVLKMVLEASNVISIF